jgi:RES domain-containing protein
VEAGVTRLWRLTKAALKHGGRYTPPGVPVVPLASEAGLAVLIALRYLPPDPRDRSDDYVLGWTDIDAMPERLAEGDDSAVRAAVESWLAEERSLLAAIPSRVLPEADVVLLNPRHRDAAQVPPLSVRPFDFADCLHEPPMLRTFRNLA